MNEKMTLQEALAALGNSKESISTKLKEMGIKGIKEFPCDCPIAHYLGICGFEKVSVNGSMVRIIGSLISCDVSGPIQEWISDFDAGLLPQFEES